MLHQTIKSKYVDQIINSELLQNNIMYQLSKNPSITWEMVERNLDKPWSLANSVNKSLYYMGIGYSVSIYSVELVCNFNAS